MIACIDYCESENSFKVQDNSGYNAKRQNAYYTLVVSVHKLSNPEICEERKQYN